VEVVLDFAAGGVSLSVTDDGSGFDPDNVNVPEGQGGFGINGMRQRAQLLNGVLTIDSSPGNGARIELSIPSS
jgi:signal transduction histidine kinase